MQAKLRNKCQAANATVGTLHEEVDRGAGHQISYSRYLSCTSSNPRHGREQQRQSREEAAPSAAPGAMAAPLEVPLRELDAVFVERLAEALTAATARPAAALPVRPTAAVCAKLASLRAGQMLLRPAVASV